ncbi:amidohydrolase family protein [Lachnospiraceae bacterium 50-23]|jgi:predicted amidohydrolase YtcJ|nr:amidohydrolase family protein [Dorea sp.]GFI37104.1 N-substituted formamide deformylase [Lachnospiraceae bacterium]
MQKADLIIISDSIYNGIDDEPKAGALVVKGSRILAVEEKDKLSVWTDEHTKIYDVGDRTVCPGFHDNHVFFTGYVWGQRGNSTEGAESRSRQMKEMFKDLEKMEEEYLEFSRLLAERGVTSIKEIGFDDYTGFTEVLKKLEDEGRMLHRVNLVSQPVDEPMDFEYAMRCREAFQGSFIRFMGFNLMVDGVIAEHEGDMLEEYRDLPGVTCAMDIPYDQLEAQVLEADRLGFRCALHAEGDGAVRKTLDIYEACRRINGKRDARHIITDLEMVHPGDVKRMAELGVTASNYFQIMELTPSSEDLYVSEVYGDDKLDRIWAYRRMEENGVVMCTGTDLPLDIPNVPVSVYYVSGRRFPDGTPQEGFQKDQGLTVAQVLKAWTYGGQYANFREHELGLLKAGKLADIAVLDSDIFHTSMEAMRDVKVMLTVCNGKIVYER